MATTKAFELAQLSAVVTSSGGVSSVSDALDVNGAEILVGTNNSRFAEDNLRFMATGASYIDVNTVGQALNFRVSETSSLDTTAISIADDGKVTLPNLTGQVAIDAGSLVIASGYNVSWGGSYSAGNTSVWGHSAQSRIKFAPDGNTSGILYQMSATQLDVNPTTTSTSSTTGALVVAGGAGIAENLNVGGDLTVTGDLTVEGSQVTLNTTALDVEDKNITLNYHASNDTSASADGAGITIQDAVNASTDATILWNASSDGFDFSHRVNVSGNSNITGNLDLAASTTETRSLQIGHGRTGDGISLIDLVGDTTYSDYGFRIQRSGTDSGKSSLLHKGTGNLEIRALQAATIRFKTTDADRMQIKSGGDISFYEDNSGTPQVGMHWDYADGRLGIGSSSICTDPQWELVVGSGATGGTNGQIFVDATIDGTGDGLTIDGDGRSAGDGALFLIIDKDNSVGLEVGTTGNVSIGTGAGSTAKLHVKNGNSSQTYSNVSGVLIDVNGNSNSYYGLRVGSSSGDDHLAVTNAGNVGMGTDNPQETLDVDGNIVSRLGPRNYLVSKQIPNALGSGNATRYILIRKTTTAGGSKFVGRISGTRTEGVSANNHAILDIGFDINSNNQYPKFYLDYLSGYSESNYGHMTARFVNLDWDDGGGSATWYAIELSGTTSANWAADLDYMSFQGYQINIDLQVISTDTGVYNAISNIVSLGQGGMKGIMHSNVGIGTSDPSSLLHVSQSNHTEIISESVGDYFPSTSIKRTGGSSKTNYHWELQIGSSGFLNFKDRTNTYYPIMLNTSGNVLLGNGQNGQTPTMIVDQSTARVGIGDITAEHKLDVDGAIATRQVRHSVRPTLNLDFANSKKLDPRITFYRDSIATYYDSKGVLRYANHNEPRFDHDPVTGESKGLLIEETEHNLFSNSDNPEKWSLTSKATSFGWQSNGMKSPDGTMNATRFFITGTDPYWYQNNLTLNGTYTFSYWIKAEGTGVGKQYTTRLTNIGTNQSIADTLPSEWTRRSFTFTSSATTTAYIGVEAPDNSPADGDTLSIWGAQLEKLPFASSYMPSLNTFRSRSSNATYYDKDGVIKTAPRDAPRYGYTHDGNKFVETGLIKEAASTNHITNHLAKNTANWYMNGSGFSGLNNPTHGFSQTQTAPDGSLTAVELNASNTSTPSISTAYNMGQTSSWSRGSWSLFVKPFGNTDVYSMWVDSGDGTKGATVQFQISTMSHQTVHTRGGTIVEYGRIEKLADGWYRIGMVVSGTLPQFQCRCYAADGVYGANEDGYGSATGGATSSANGTYFWGAQVEEGTAASGASISSYIYGGGGTTRAQDIGLGTAATRKIDVAHLDNILYADWNNEEEGTFYTEYEVPYDIEDISVNYRVLERHTEGTGQNVTSILLNSGTNQTNAGAYNNSGWQALMGVSNSLGVTDKNVLNKLAFAFKDNDFGVSIQGSPIAQDSSGTVTRGATRLQLGSNSSLANTLNGHLKIVKFYPERLSNAELVALTENN